MIYKRAESKFYWVRLEKDGRVIQRSTKCRHGNKQGAKEFEAKLRLSEFGPEGLSGNQTPTNLVDLTKLLYPFWTRNCAPRTARFYKDAIRPLLAFDPIAKCPLHQIRQPLIEQFFTARLAEGAAVITVNHSIRSLRRALHIAAENLGVINAAPKLSTLKNEHVRDAVVSEPDFLRLLASCGRKAEQIAPKVHVREGSGKETTRALLTVLYDCGLRAGEAVKLKWENVNLAERWLFVEDGKNKWARRKVGLTARVVTALSGLKASARPGVAFVFTRHQGHRPITVGWASHEFMRTRRALDLPDGVVLHSLRHSAATRLGNRGANVLDLQKVMGWSSPVIAARYVHLDDTRMQTLAGLLEPLQQPMQEPLKH